MPQTRHVVARVTRGGLHVQNPWNPKGAHSINQDTHILTRADAVFGAYLGALLLFALAAWLIGTGGPASILVFGGFIVVNAAISRVSRSGPPGLCAEIARIASGAFIAPVAYLLAGEPFIRWWPGFLIMCVGGSIYVSLRMRSAWPGRGLAIYYAALLAVSELLAPAPHDWYMVAVNAGTVAAVGILVADLAALLGRALAAAPARLPR